MPSLRGLLAIALAVLPLAACSSDDEQAYLDNPVDAVYPVEYATVLDVRPMRLRDAGIVDTVLGQADGFQYTVVRRDGSTLIVEQADTGVDGLIGKGDRVVIQQTQGPHFHVLPTFQVRPLPPPPPSTAETPVNSR